MLATRANVTAVLLTNAVGRAFAKAPSGRFSCSRSSRVAGAEFLASSATLSHRPKAALCVTSKVTYSVRARKASSAMDSGHGAATDSSNPAPEEHAPRKSAAIVGAGIAGVAAASQLANHGCQVSVFDLGRGPGGRMSQRRDRISWPTTGSSSRQSQDATSGPSQTETIQIKFDHGAQYFSSGNPEVATFLAQFREKGLLAEWLGRFGTWSASSKTLEEASPKERLVCTPGMNSICQHALAHPRIKTIFSTHVAEVDWDSTSNQFEVKASSGESLGKFDAVVIAAAYRTFRVGIKVPSSLKTPEIQLLEAGVTDVPAEPCFALMVTFPVPQSSIPFDGAKVSGCPIVAWAARDSSKPGRKVDSEELLDLPENWVVHSTSAYAKSVMKAAPPGKPSPELLDRVAQEMLAAFRGLVESSESIPDPVFLKVHRWGGAFPSESRASEGHKFLSGGELPVVACGDFCISPRVESAIESALAASDFLVAKLQLEASRM